MLPEQLVSHWAIGDRVPSLALAEAFSRGGGEAAAGERTILVDNYFIV